jgi:hypothetical protein
MIQPTLLFGAILSTVSAGIYYYVGRVLSRRRSASTDAHLAWVLFVVWWYALAATTLSSAILSLLGALGIAGLALFSTFTLVNLLATCVALYSLMFYLLYLFTGNRRLLGPLALSYIAYYILLVYYIQASNPTSVTVERWRATLEYQNQIRGPLFLIALLLLVFPQIIGSLAYFTLFFRVKTVTQKYRILLVSWSIIIWFLSAFLASISGLSQQDWWQIASRLISLSAALAILLAYQPPHWIKRRFGVTSIADEQS